VLSVDEKPRTGTAVMPNHSGKNAPHFRIPGNSFIARIFAGI
jgi:hypothetical protein